MKCASQCSHPDTCVLAYEIAVTLDSMSALLETRILVYNSESYAMCDPI